jgi:hypothetical protein
MSVPESIVSPFESKISFPRARWSAYLHWASSRLSDEPGSQNHFTDEVATIAAYFQLFTQYHDEFIRCNFQSDSEEEIERLYR